MKYSLLFIDLDGTLVGPDQIVTPRTLSALNRANEQGCRIVISTARNRFMVEQVAAQWRGHGYVILSNGAIIADWSTGTVLEKISLRPSIVRKAAKIAHDLEVSPLCFGVDSEIDGGERLYTDMVCPLTEVYLNPNRKRLIYRENLEFENSLEPVGIGAYGAEDQMRRLAVAWRRDLDDEVAVFDSLDPKYGCWCTFLNAKNADKAEAAKRVATLLGVERGHTMAIGDHLNDLEMLRWAGLGICMGDGHEEARAASGYVTGTLSEDGVAQAIERFVLTPA